MARGVRSWMPFTGRLSASLTRSANPLANRDRPVPEVVAHTPQVAPGTPSPPTTCWTSSKFMSVCQDPARTDGGPVGSVQTGTRVLWGPPLPAGGASSSDPTGPSPM